MDPLTDPGWPARRARALVAELLAAWPETPPSQPDVTPVTEPPSEPPPGGSPATPMAPAPEPAAALPDALTATITPALKAGPVEVTGEWVRAASPAIRRRLLTAWAWLRRTTPMVAAWLAARGREVATWIGAWAVGLREASARRRAPRDPAPDDAASRGTVRRPRLGRTVEEIAPGTSARTWALVAIGFLLALLILIPLTAASLRDITLR